MLPPGSGRCRCARFRPCPTTRPLQSPLHERHVALGAKFAEFGGWACRWSTRPAWSRSTPPCAPAVGLFDVSHLGKATVTGPGAAAYVNATLTNDLGRIAPGQAQYTLCCDDETGGVVDDLIVYYRSDEDVLLVPERRQHRRGGAPAAAAAPDGVAVTDRHRDYAVLARAGPAQRRGAGRGRPARRATPT